MSEAATREELWRCYRKAGLFDSRRMQRLADRFADVEATWDLLLAGGDGIVWHDFERVDGEVRSTCINYRHTERTRITQHWVSVRNALGNMKVLLNSLKRFDGKTPDRYARSYFRPGNPLGVRLFRSLYELVPHSAASLTLFEILQLDAESAAQAPLATPSSAGSFSGFWPAIGANTATPRSMRRDELKAILPGLMAAVGEIEIKAEFLDGDDPNCEALSEDFAKGNLKRARAVFPILRNSGTTGSENIAGIIVADMSSFGLSLSGFNNAARILMMTPLDDPAPLIQALSAAADFYLSHGIASPLIFADAEIALQIERESSMEITRGGPCHMATFEMCGEYGTLIERHIRAFYEARVGLARIVTELSEEEIDWINERGQKFAFHSGDTLIKEGEMAESLMLIQSGEVGIFQGEGRARKQLAIVRAPDVVGEIGVLEGVRRTASVVAISPVIALNVSKQRIQEFFRIFPEGAESLRKALAFRLEHDKEVQDLAEKWRTKVAGVLQK